jgi:hypothetical protein
MMAAWFIALSTLFSYSSPTMKKSFLYGTISGMSALALAVPLLAQVSSAASSAANAIPADLPAPSQACVEALVAADDAFLARIDAQTEARKAAMQAHRDALAHAAAIADDEQRKAAVQAAHQDMRTAMEASRPADEEGSVMDAVKEACGDSMHGFGMKLHMGGDMMVFRHHGPAPEMLAEKLGMTADELKAALEAGKLPAKRMMFFRGKGMPGMHDMMFEEKIKLESSSTESVTSETTPQ